MSREGASREPLIIVGGSYRERSAFPLLDNFYGSGLRSAAAVSGRGITVRLHTFVEEGYRPHLTATASAFGIDLSERVSLHTYVFDYLHSLAPPLVTLPAQERFPAPLEIKGDTVLSFGMMEGNAVVHAKQAVYDPQSPNNPMGFRLNGSTAERLAVVCNQTEARSLAGNDDLMEAGKMLLVNQRAEVVIIKQGARGALLFTSGNCQHVSPYRATPRSLIGSGDVFTAVFAFHWMILGHDPASAAGAASEASAYYCNTQVLPVPFPLPKSLPLIEPSTLLNPQSVYLAGPFFNPAQLWMVEETRRYLTEQGMSVFSPYHEVGVGDSAVVASKDLAALRSSDLLFALLDGRDSGTLFEIGYARAIGKRVVAYHTAEGAADLTMLLGSDCEVFDNFVAAIYSATWRK